MNKPGYSELGELVPAIPGMQLRHTLRGHQREIISMAWSPDGMLLASGGRDKTVRVWNTETGDCLETLTGYRNPVDHLAWSQDSRILASYPFVESFWIQLANSMRFELEWIKDFFRTGLLSYVKRVVPIEPFSPAASVRLWDVAEGKATNEPFIRVRNPIVFSWVDERLLYVSPFRDAKGDPHVHVRSCVGNELEHELRYPLDYPYRESVSRAVFSHDGKMLAACSGYGPIVIWDMKSGELLGNFNPFGGARDSLAWSSDKNLLAIGTFGAIHIMDVRKGTVIKSLEGNQSGIMQLLFSADGRFLASQSFNEKLGLFSCDTWKTVVRVMEPADRGVRNGLAFHPSRPWIATRTDGDRAICIWEMGVETLLASGK